MPTKKSANSKIKLRALKAAEQLAKYQLKDFDKVARRVNKKKKKPTAFKFTIDRSTWLRGKMGGYLLVNREAKKDISSDIKSDIKLGSMCCLGHYALACGLQKRKISGKQDPQDIVCKNEQFLKLLKFESDMMVDTDNTDMLIYTNDDPDITDKVREKTLKELFKNIDVIVDFKG